MVSQRSIGARGDADATTAWTRYAELALWSTWSPQILGVRASGERLATGMTGIVLGPLGLRIPFTVLQARHADRVWVWRIEPFGLTAELRHTVEATDDGCATRLDVRGPFWFALLYPTLSLPALRRLVRA